VYDLFQNDDTVILSNTRKYAKSASLKKYQLSLKYHKYHPSAIDAALNFFCEAVNMSFWA
jgi:hypothetical protein